MLKSFVVACGLQAALLGCANAAGPFGSIHVGNWIGGAFTDDRTGTFSHCAATAPYANGVNLVVGRNEAGSWLLSLARPGVNLKQGVNVPIDLIFDGQQQVRLFGAANGPNMVTFAMPDNVVRSFQKASLMVATAGDAALQFNLTSTGPMITALANCVTRVKADGLDKAGDFTKTVARPVATRENAASPPPASKPVRTGNVTGTGFVVSPNGHIVTNNHVIRGCIGDIKGNLTGEASMVLRVVSTDAGNDLALLQAPATTAFKDFVKIRDRSTRSGDSIVAIGFPLHGLLTSDFTVTTGIVSSLIGNDTRHLQISAAVQPGNSGGPLFDTSGLLAGVVVAKLDAMFVMKATGTIPENINFAIKNGALRDFLDNSVVSYQIAEPKVELKTTEIAGNARAYTMLIACTAAEEAEAKR